MGQGDIKDESERFEGVNILRERTFNPELRDLVNRIKRHEDSEDRAPLPEDVSSMSRNDLMRGFHSLFYKVKYLDDYSACNSSFNPFAGYDKKFDRPDGLLFIGHGLRRMGLTDYSVLVYDFSMECFHEAFSNGLARMKGAVVIGLNDNLYSDIMNAEYGFALSPESIRANNFLSKKFSTLAGQDDKLLYFIPFSRIAEPAIGDLSRSYKIKSYPTNCSPILMLIIDADMGGADRAHLVKNLMRDMSLAFFIFCDEEHERLQTVSYDNLLIIIDYFQTIFFKRTDSVAVVLSSDRFHQREVLVSMKYICSRLDNILDDESVIFRIAVNRIFVMTCRSMLGQIENFVKEYSGLLDGALSMETVSIDELASSDMILRDYFS